jgi:hypothetical protein
MEKDKLKAGQSTPVRITEGDPLDEKTVSASQLLLNPFDVLHFPVAESGGNGNSPCSQSNWHRDSHSCC